LLQTDHDELTVLEPQTWITGALETEEGVVPVMNAKDTLVIHVAHGTWELLKNLRAPVEAPLRSILVADTISVN
jgi:hypothetical protein